MQAVMEAPARSLAQRMDALGIANEVRSYRKLVKRDLKAGRRTFSDVLADPMCETMKVMDVLLALPRVGRSKSSEALNRSRVSPSKTCGGITERQRDELLRRLGRFGREGVTGLR